MSTKAELPVSGSAGRSDTLLLEETEDLTGTGKNPLRNRAMLKTSHMRQSNANTDELNLMMNINDTLTT